MTRIVPPPRTLMLALPPLGDWTVTDPNGIIDSITQEGSRVTVAFNAVAGAAYLTRPHGLNPDEFILGLIELAPVVWPTTGAALKLGWGVSSTTPLVEQALNALELAATTVTRHKTQRNGITGGGHATTQAVRFCGTVEVADNVYSTARWSDVGGGLEQNGVGAVPRWDGSAQGAGYFMTEECIGLYTTGSAADTATWDVLRSLKQPMSYSR